MGNCESKIGGICVQPAVWKQTVNAGKANAGRFLMNSYWCELHADKIVQKRKQDWQPPAQMERMTPEPAPEATPEAV